MKNIKGTKVLETHVRCETGRTLVLPRLATGRLHEDFERDARIDLLSAA